MHCPRCGNISNDDQLFCNRCGTKFVTPEFDTKQLFENIAINSGVLTSEPVPDAEPAIRAPRVSKEVRTAKKPNTKKKGVASSLILLGILSIATSAVIATVYMFLTHNQAAAINNFAQALASSDVDELRKTAVFLDLEPTDDELLNMASSFDEEDLMLIKIQLNNGESRDFSSFSIAEVPLTWPFNSFVVTVSSADFQISGLTSDIAVRVNGVETATEFSGDVCVVSGLVPGSYEFDFGTQGSFQPLSATSFKQEGEIIQAIAIEPIVEPEPEPEPEPAPEPEPEPEPEPTPEPEPEPVPENLSANEILFNNVSTAVYEHYKSYLLSQTNEDMSVITYSTEAAIADAQQRLDNYNRGNNFELVSLKVDLDTLAFNTVDTTTTADVLVQVVFSSASKDEPDNKTETTSTMIFNLQQQPDGSWLVNSRESSDAAIGTNLKVY